MLSVIAVSVPVSTLAQAATEKKNRLIVPGKSIGPFRLGSNDDFADFGEGGGDQTQGRKAYFYWPPESKPRSPIAPYFAYYIVRDDDGHWPTTTIRVTSHRYITARGISTHSTLAEIKRAYPHLKRGGENTTKEGLNTADYTDDALGIAFDITENAPKGTYPCYGIYVYPAHTDRLFGMPRVSPTD